ncbi:ESX secretion-associated protein EspG [Nocardia sp. CDC159]|uniref:ESX secretion-associated protein EspG n=1 Tax=Nocardia pulmonis TaxID=2951408 RepID=A0A9X2J0Q3_9NOCA|nr:MULTISPECIES: ESX secretion-associated protein EspG [Nocardia]MCM6776171.1 ESX secretion-associated protein EspG [Nocardia pulmonis]MCM6788503.1 ESX secretion-associated protein EspG [Nocardia sp. CDC159]
MTNTTWRYTDLEFVVLWERYSDLPFPSPLLYTSRFSRQDDYEREKRRIWEQLCDRVPTEVVWAIGTLGRPDVCVTAQGWCDQDVENPDKHIRISAARSAVAGYVVTQLPGETRWHSGGYTIAECPARQLAATLVAALPEVAAGSRPNIPIVQPGGIDPYKLFDDSRDTPETRSRRFLELPAATTGRIRVRQGRSKFGQRGIAEQVFSWRDLADDGRYVIAEGDDRVAVGTGPQRLIRILDEAIEAMVTRLETHWETGESTAGEWSVPMRRPWG